MFAAATHPSPVPACPGADSDSAAQFVALAAARRRHSSLMTSSLIASSLSNAATSSRPLLTGLGTPRNGSLVEEAEEEGAHLGTDGAQGRTQGVERAMVGAEGGTVGTEGGTVGAEEGTKGLDSRESMRRRAMDASDLRTSAFSQTGLNNWSSFQIL